VLGIDGADVKDDDLLGYMVSTIFLIISLVSSSMVSTSQHGFFNNGLGYVRISSTAISYLLQALFK
jgi:hypothetical protein